MIPIKDTNPSVRPPRMMWVLILLNVVVFLFELTLSPRGQQELFLLWGVVPRRFMDPAWAASVGFPGGGYTAFVTSMFMHGGFLHIIANMWALWIFGDNVEDRMGHLRFLVFYLLCGLAAGVTHVVTNAGSVQPVVGASGALAGVLAAYMFMFPFARVLVLLPILIFPFFFELPAVVFIVVWIGMQLLSGTAALGAPEAAGGIAWWAHIGGFGAGVVLHRLFVPPGRLPRRRPPLQVRGP